MDWTDNDTAFLFARVQNAAHMRTSVVHSEIIAINIVDSDEMTFQLYGDAAARGNVIGLGGFHESGRVLTDRR